MRLVGEAELEDIAVGAAILGTGGGGDPYIGKLLAQEAVRRYGPVEMVDVDEVLGRCVRRPVRDDGRADGDGREAAARRPR